MNKIKVLHIITRLDAGGSATNTMETVARLDSEKYEAVLVAGKTLDPQGDIAEFIRQKNIECVFIDDLRREVNLWRDIKVFFQLAAFIRREKFNIVHTHSSKAGILGRWAAWLAGTKCIIHTPHGHVFYGYFSKVISEIFIWVERLTAIITKRIITLTDVGKQEHIQYKIAQVDKFVTIYSGIDLIRFQGSETAAQSVRTEFSLTDQEQVIGTVGRLDEIKGTIYLIEAMPEVLTKFPRARLILVGDGDQRERLSQRVKALNIEKAVIFAGYRADVAAVMAVMDIFVLPSINEGMGRVILEAFACAKPVVATKAGGVPNLIMDGQDGVLVPPKSSKSLSAAVIDLLQHPDKAKTFACRGNEKVGTQYTLEKMVKDIEALYCAMPSIKGD